MGVLLRFSKENIDVWLQHHPDHKTNLFYGLLLMIPAMVFMKIDINISQIFKPVHLLNLLYMGACASALCFVTWNMAVKYLGAIKTSAYIYAVPVITIITSALILKERITPIALLGTALALVGLFLSERKSGFSFKAKKGDEIE